MPSTARARRFSARRRAGWLMGRWVLMETEIAIVASVLILSTMCALRTCQPPHHHHHHHRRAPFCSGCDRPRGQT
eukprot:5145680-Prymnesium_polylepis.1